MKNLTRTGTILFVVLVVPAQSIADSVIFPTDIPDFQDAVNSVSPGDTVLVEPGDWSAGYTFMPSGVTVAALNGDPASTTLRGHLHVRDRDGIVLRGLRFPSFQAISCVSSEMLFENVWMSYSGGYALYCEDSDVTVRTGTFYNNLQAVRAEGSNLSFEDVSFTYNGHTRNGAGLHAQDCDVTMARCRFWQNEVGYFDYTNTSWTYGGQGAGALLRDGSTLIADDVDFDANHTWQAGAGLALVGAGTYAQIRGGSFTGNTTSTDISSDGALQRGAALYVDGATAMLDGVWFSDNWSNSIGGAVYCEGGASVTVTNCVFVENASVGEGSAAYGPLQVANCTFVDNAAEFGSTIYAGEAQHIYNSIFCCTPGAISTTNTFLSHCCVWSSGTDGGKDRQNINADPLFCAYEAGDLTLCEDSPCLPENNDWGELVGALGVGCGPCDTAVEHMTWGAIKAMFRSQ